MNPIVGSSMIDKTINSFTTGLLLPLLVVIFMQKRDKKYQDREGSCPSRITTGILKIPNVTGYGIVTYIVNKLVQNGIKLNN